MLMHSLVYIFSSVNLNINDNNNTTMSCLRTQPQHTTTHIMHTNMQICHNHMTHTHSHTHKMAASSRGKQQSAVQVWIRIQGEKATVEKRHGEKDSWETSAGKTSKFLAIKYNAI